MPAIKGKRQQRGEERRAAILEAASTLMSTRGFKGTSLAAVAEAVGVTEPGVLHHFASKEELLLAVLQQRQVADRPEIDAWSGDGGLAALQSLRLLPRAIQADPSAARILTVLSAEHLDDGSAVHEWFVERGRSVRGRIAALLRAGVERGEFKADVDCDLKAAELVAFMDGIQAQWFLDPEAIDLVAAYGSYLDALIGAIVTDEVLAAR